MSLVDLLTFFESLFSCISKTNFMSIDGGDLHLGNVILHRNSD